MKVIFSNKRLTSSNIQSYIAEMYPKLSIKREESKVISYFYNGNEVTKEKYMKELEVVGWKPKSVSYLWNRFQSFDIEKIESISIYGK